MATPSKEIYGHVHMIANFSANDVILVIFIGFLFTKYQNLFYSIFNIIYYISCLCNYLFF